MTKFELITTPEALRQVAQRLARETIIAFDLEADSMHHYREQVCLLQISTSSENLIIDPLACTDFSPLVPLFSNASILKIFHGADYDVRMLHRSFGIEIHNLFDTMIACQFLGESAVGLAAALKKRFGVELDKRYQQADWSRRPLPAEMLDYAAKDTSLLIPLYQQLIAELSAKGRLSWVEEECALLTKVRMTERSDEPLSLRFKGASRLRGGNLAVLEEILRFRDEEAERRDLPPFKVLGNETIRELAERVPTSAADLSGIPGLSPKLLERHGRGILQTVKRAREMPAQLLPVFPRKQRPERSREQEARLKQLKEWRTKKSAELGIDPGIMANNALLDELAEVAPERLTDVSGIKEWQVAAFGEDLLRIVRE
jgi:ribonuclease D